jgi:hypothetical protein
MNKRQRKKAEKKKSSFVASLIESVKECMAFNIAILRLRATMIGAYVPTKPKGARDDAH